MPSPPFGAALLSGFRGRSRSFWILFAIVTTVILGGAIALAFPPDALRHDHASFLVVVNGERLSFNASAFDFAATSFAPAHLHTDEPHPGVVIHMESWKTSAAPNVTLAAFFGSLGMDLGQGHLRVARVLGNGSYDDNATSELSILVRQDHAAAFAREPVGAAHVLASCDRILVAYGARGAPLDAFEAAIPAPPEGTTSGRCA